MRMIGQLRDEAGAKLFGDYLVARGIDNQLERESDGSYIVWIHSEDHLDEARRELEVYSKNPEDPKFHEEARSADEKRTKKRKEQAEFEKKIHTRQSIWPRTNVGRLTLVLIITSVGVFLLSGMGRDRAVLNLLFLDLPRVFRGEVWRLISPIFLHLSELHILFNMLWLYSLGTVIERRQGTRYFALMVITIGVASNLGQYFLVSPFFGGMSGVVFGLLGYVWIKWKLDPFSGYYVDHITMTIMMIWFLLGWTGALGVANVAHGVGLLSGLLWGYISAQARHHR